MTGLDATIARALSGYDAGDVLSFDSLREAANAAQLGPLRVVVDGIEYDCTRPTEHQAGVHRLIRHYRRTSVPIPLAVAS